MRSRSSVNFPLEDLHTIAQWSHEHGMKSYLTVNTIVYDEDMDYMRQIVTAARDAQVNAIIAPATSCTYGKLLSPRHNLAPGNS